MYPSREMTQIKKKRKKENNVEYIARPIDIIVVFDGISSDVNERQWHRIAEYPALVTRSMGY